MLEVVSNLSHLDHGLSSAHLEWILEKFKDREAFFLETVVIPMALSPLECGLYGPLMGDEPVMEDEVTYIIRGARKCASRVVARPMRTTRLVTVIAGPANDKPCVNL